MANTGKDASGSTIYLWLPFSETGADNSNAYGFGSVLGFGRNSSKQVPTLDTSTPANNRPLPVVFCADSGAPATIKAASTPATATDTAQVFDLRNYPAPVAQTVTIASSASLSGAVALASAFPVALLVPSGWTAAGITFQGSIDGGTTYANIRTSGGSEVTVNVTTAGDIYTVNPLDFAGFTHLKVRSGTAGTPVNQSSSATLSLVTRGAL